MSSVSEDDSSDTSSEDRHGFLRNLRIVSLATLLSRVLGLARDMAMATVFGAGTILDVFVVAFRLPNLARQLFGEGALTTAFLPIFVRQRNEHGVEAARGTLTAVAVALSAFLLSVVLVTECLVACALSWSELSPSTVLLLHLLAILLPYMIFICNAALMSAALHAQGVFLWPALVPVVLNTVWLMGISVTLQLTNDPQQQIRAISVWIAIAGFLQMSLPCVTLHRMGMGLTAGWRAHREKVREVLLLMMPVVAGIAVTQLNAILDSVMAWGLSIPDSGDPAPFAAVGLPAWLSSGTTTALYLGQRMYQFPLGVFGIALGTVLFPLLTRHAQAGEHAALRDDLSRGVRLTVAIALPASAGLMLLSTPLAFVLFRHGQYSADDARLTANVIAVYGSGVWSYIGITILNRAFYATGDRMTPMRLGLISLSVNVALNVALVWPFKGMGLALGSVLASILQLVLTTWKLNHKLGPLDWPSILRTGLKTAVATVVMSVVCLAINRPIPHLDEALWSRLFQLVVSFLAGVVSYLLTAKLLRIPEVADVLFRRQNDS